LFTCLQCTSWNTFVSITVYRYLDPDLQLCKRPDPHITNAHLKHLITSQTNSGTGYSTVFLVVEFCREINVSDRRYRYRYPRLPFFKNCTQSVMSLLPFEVKLIFLKAKNERCPSQFLENITVVMFP
jgi:hypothetical protein